MQEQVYSFKDCLLLNPLSSLPLPGTISTVSVAFMCCSVPLFMFLDNWWQGRWGVGLDSLQREVPAKHSDSVIYQQCAGTYSSYSDPDYSTQPEAHQPCFSTYSQVPAKDSLGCFHPTRCACSPMHPGILVLWATTWAKNPGHIASTW